MGMGYPEAVPVPPKKVRLSVFYIFPRAGDQNEGAEKEQVPVKNVAEKTPVIPAWCGRATGKRGKKRKGRRLAPISLALPLGW